MADARITALPLSVAKPSSDAEWYVIHAGKEVGPLALAELVGKAAVGEINPDDLVKQPGGLWTKARDLSFLQEQFLLRKSREEAPQRSSRQISQKTEGKVNHAGLVIFTIGAILFLFAHGHELFAGPGGSSTFLLRFFVYGLFFVVPFLLARRQQYSGILVASLFFLAAGSDVAVSVYLRVIDTKFVDERASQVPNSQEKGEVMDQPNTPDMSSGVVAPLPDWEEIAPSIKEQFPSADMDALKQHWEQSSKMARAHLAAGAVKEGTGDILRRTALPGWSAAGNIYDAAAYDRAKQRLAAGKPEPKDYQTIADYEERQKRGRRRPLPAR